MSEISRDKEGRPYPGAPYCLIGEGLRHSFLPLVHKSFGIGDCRVCEILLEDLERTLKDTFYKGFNITAPYKREVMSYCDVISEEALEIGSVNTIIRGETGRLSGHNTDIDGFLYGACLAGIDFYGKKVLIFGSGGAALTARYAARESGALQVTMVSRSGKVDYSMLGEYADAEIVINATPVGMYPDNLKKPASLSLFPACEGLVDLVCNPRRTVLIMEAQKRDIPCVDGLPMLVYQAKRARELFRKESIPDSEAKRVLNELRLKTENIIIIGMPGSGKSSVARAISEKTGRPFIDLDTEIVRTAGRSIPDIFSSDGEAFFRKMEREHVKKIGMQSGAVIATGGGVVKSLSNYSPLRQNGRIYCLNRAFEDLDMSDRPLSSSADTLKKMLMLREPMYRFFADRHIDNSGSPEAAADMILEDFYSNAGGDTFKS